MECIIQQSARGEKLNFYIHKEKNAIKKVVVKRSSLTMQMLQYFVIFPIST